MYRMDRVSVHKTVANRRKARSETIQSAPTSRSDRQTPHSSCHNLLCLAFSSIAFAVPKTLCALRCAHEYDSKSTSVEWTTQQQFSNTYVKCIENFRILFTRCIASQLQFGHLRNVSGFSQTEPRNTYVWQCDATKRLFYCSQVNNGARSKSSVGLAIKLENRIRRSGTFGARN